MKKDPYKEEEVVHEHDAFIKMMIGLKESALAKQKLLTTALLVVILGFVAMAVFSAIDEQRTDSRLNTADSAVTIEQMEAAVAECADDTGLLLRLARAYGERNEAGDVEKAHGLLARAVAAAGNDIEKAVAALAPGKAKMDMKKYEEALALFNDAAVASDVQALTQDEANWHAGRCLEQLGQLDKARERYDKIGLLTERRSAGPWEALADFRKTELRRESRD